MIRYVLLIVCLGWFIQTCGVRAQHPQVCSAVLTQGPRPGIGAHSLPTGLFVWAGDTTWRHFGPPNIRAFHATAHRDDDTVYLGTSDGLYVVDLRRNKVRRLTGRRVPDALWVAFRPPALLIIATSRGLFRSTDAGVHWEPGNEGLAYPPFVSQVVADVGRPNVWWAAAHTGAYISEDSGQSWRRLSLSAVNVRMMAQHAVRPETLLAATEDDGLWRSEDSGVTWRRLHDGLADTTFYTLAFHPVHAETVYAGGYQTGVYVSQDTGETWKSLSPGPGHADVHTISVTGSQIWVGTLHGGAYRSDDDGVTWLPAGLSGAQVWSIITAP